MVGALDVFPIEKVLPEGQDFIPTMYDDWQVRLLESPVVRL